MKACPHHFVHPHHHNHHHLHHLHHLRHLVQPLQLLQPLSRSPMCAPFPSCRYSRFLVPLLGNFLTTAVLVVRCWSTLMPTPKCHAKHARIGPPERHPQTIPKLPKKLLRPWVCLAPRIAASTPHRGGSTTVIDRRSVGQPWADPRVCPQKCNGTLERPQTKPRKCLV